MKLLCAFAAIAAAAAANPNLILSHEGLEAGLKLDSNGDINVYAADVAGACVDRRNWCGRYKRDDCTAGAPVKSRLMPSPHRGLTVCVKGGVIPNSINK